MTYGIQTFDAAGTLLWDSSTAAAGVVADVQNVAGGASATFTYPDFAGRSAAALVLLGFGNTGVTADTALGYPRVTVPNYPDPRTVLVLVL